MFLEIFLDCQDLGFLILLFCRKYAEILNNKLRNKDNF